jgi:hypothetical protein
MSDIAGLILVCGVLLLFGITIAGCILTCQPPFFKDMATSGMLTTNYPQIDTIINVTNYDYVGQSIVLIDENGRGYIKPLFPALYYYHHKFNISYYCDPITNQRFLTRMSYIEKIPTDPSQCITINGVCQ